MREPDEHDHLRARVEGIADQLENDESKKDMALFALSCREAAQEVKAE